LGFILLVQASSSEVELATATVTAGMMPTARAEEYGVADVFDRIGGGVQDWGSGRGDERVTGRRD